MGFGVTLIRLLVDARASFPHLPHRDSAAARTGCVLTGWFQQWSTGEAASPNGSPLQSRTTCEGRPDGPFVTRRVW